MTYFANPSTLTELSAFIAAQQLFILNPDSKLVSIQVPRSFIVDYADDNNIELKNDTLYISCGGGFIKITPEPVSQKIARHHYKRVPLFSNQVLTY